MGTYADTVPALLAGLVLTAGLFVYGALMLIGWAQRAAVAEDADRD